MTTAAVLGWGGDCMNDNATDTGPFIAWRHANGATICSTLLVDDWQKLQSCCSVPSCPFIQRTQCNAPCDTLRIFLVIFSAEIRWIPSSLQSSSASSVCPCSLTPDTVSIVWCDQWNVDVKLDNLVDIFPSIMQHGITMLVATHDTGPRRYPVSGFVRDFIWCLWQEILTRRALRLSAVP